MNLSKLIEKAAVELEDEQGVPVTSLRDRVFRGRESFGENDPLPMVSLLEPPLSIERIASQPDNPNAAGAWDILIQGWAVDDKDNPTDPAYRLAAWVVQTLAKERTKMRGRPGSKNYLGLGDRITEIKVGAPVVRPADFPSANACFYLLITLQIVEDMEDPFC